MPDRDYLLQCFDYHAENGTVTWRVRPTGHFFRAQDCAPWNKRYASRAAGTVRKTPIEYVYLRIMNENWLAHRVIYKMVTGNEPINEVDHRDTDSLNNRWSNLREATEHENNRNTTKKRDTFFPLKGVVKSVTDGKYQSRVYINGRQIWLGTFDSMEAAHDAYCDAAKMYHGEFFRAG